MDRSRTMVILLTFAGVLSLLVTPAQADPSNEGVLQYQQDSEDLDGFLRNLGEGVRGVLRGDNSSGSTPSDSRVQPGVEDTSVDRRPAVNLYGLTRDENREIQQRLADLGFDPGVADGLPGPKTRSAIEAYQTAAGLQVDGRPSAALLAHLQGSALQMVSGESSDAPPTRGEFGQGDRVFVDFANAPPAQTGVPLGDDVAAQPVVPEDVDAESSTPSANEPAPGEAVQTRVEAVTIDPPASELRVLPAGVTAAAARPVQPGSVDRDAPAITGDAGVAATPTGSAVTVLALSAVLIAGGVGAYLFIRYRRHAHPAPATVGGKAATMRSRFDDVGTSGAVERAASGGAFPVAPEELAETPVVDPAPDGGVAEVVRFCTECGARLPVDSRFCVECGAQWQETGMA